MTVSREKSRSVWMDTPVLDAPTLDKSVACDTVVVGSGIAGLSVAYELARAGQGVVVIDPSAKG